LTIDSLLAADVVLSDGTLAVASANENTDLFWAIRGGGGNFGVVASFLFQAHPVQMVCAGPMLWPNPSRQSVAWVEGRFMSVGCVKPAQGKNVYRVG